MGRQHPGMYGLDTGCRHEESGETRGVEGAGCQGDDRSVYGHVILVFFVQDITCIMKM